MCSEQVKVLALTDHDTLAGIPEAIEAARRFGIKIIPGVEISTIFSSRFYLFSAKNHHHVQFLAIINYNGLYHSALNHPQYALLFLGSSHVISNFFCGVIRKNVGCLSVMKILFW